MERDIYITTHFSDFWIMLTWNMLKLYTRQPSVMSQVTMNADEIRHYPELSGSVRLAVCGHTKC